MESQASFMQGRAAMWLDGIGFSVPVEDKTKSRVAGRVQYVMQPKGPKAQHSGSFADGMGVSAFSDKQEAAYLYCQWATSKPMAARQLQGGYGAPGRSGVYTDQEVLRLHPDGAGRPLQRPLPGYDDLEAARTTCAEALADLPPEARRLDPGPAAWTATMEDA